MVEQPRSWACTQTRLLIQKDMCNPVFIATLFTIAKTWKQPKYPSADDWRKKMGVHVHNGLLLGRKKERMPFAATWMQLEISY